MNVTISVVGYSVPFRFFQEEDIPKASVSMKEFIWLRKSFEIYVNIKIYI